MGRKRALIVGGSLAGLFAAHLLRTMGWEAEVFERNLGDLASHGAGIGTHDALIDCERTPVRGSRQSNVCALPRRYYGGDGKA